MSAGRLLLCWLGGEELLYYYDNFIGISDRFETSEKRKKDLMNFFMSPEIHDEARQISLYHSPRDELLGISNIVTPQTRPLYSPDEELRAANTFSRLPFPPKESIRSFWPNYPSGEYIIKPRYKPRLPMMPPAVFAVWSKAPELLRPFLARPGARLNTSDFLGRTALHHAAITNQSEMADMLLTAGADLNIRDVLKHTPLFAAVSANAADTIRVLIKHGADPNAIESLPDNFSLNALGYAVYKAQAEALTALIDGGADVKMSGLRLKDSTINFCAYTLAKYLSITEKDPEKKKTYTRISEITSREARKTEQDKSVLAGVAGAIVHALIVYLLILAIVRCLS